MKYHVLRCYGKVSVQITFQETFCSIKIVMKKFEFSVLFSNLYKTKKIENKIAGLQNKT